MNDGFAFDDVGYTPKRKRYHLANSTMGNIIITDSLKDKR